MIREFYTSDTHWNHRNIIKYCERPFVDIDEMNEGLIKTWNETVGPQDIVYHGGDFALGNKKHIAGIRKRLNGRIILVKGNHDPSTQYMRDAGFDEVVGHIEREVTIGWEAGLVGHPPFVNESKTFKLTMRHHPPLWEKYHEVPKVDGIMLCGHVHELFKRMGNIINVGCDVWGMKPVSLTELLMAPEDANPVTGHGRCKRDMFTGAMPCTDPVCKGFFKPQGSNEAPTVM